MTESPFQSWEPPFGWCQRCGDPVKRPAARLCSSCWWDVQPTTEHQPESTDVLTTGSGEVS